MTADERNPMEAQRWEGEMGDKWAAHLDQFEGMLAPIGAALIGHGAFAPGERVIDIGCGGGATTLEIARQVGAQGEVVGLDIAPVLVREARRRAAQAGLPNVSFVCGDAAQAKPGRNFDCLFSRFGVMFFEDPYAAFANMRGLLREGGRLAFACWASPQDNAWVMQLMGIVGRYVTLAPPQPRAPGPFAFAEPDYVRDILGRAGFRDIALQRWQGHQLVGGPGADPAAAARFMAEALFVGEALKGQDEAIRNAVLAEVEALFARHHDRDGVRMAASVWLVSGRA